MKLDWETVLDLIDKTQHDSARFDVYDEDLLCRTKEDAECIADFIEHLGVDTMHIHEIEKDEGDWYPYTYTVYPDWE